MPAQTKTEISVKDLAQKLDTEPRALRAFLRRDHQAAGKGARYAFDPAAVREISKAWKADQAAAAAGASEETTADTAA